LQSFDDSSTLLSVTSFPGEESRMSTVEFITALFYEVDEQLGLDHGIGHFASMSPQNNEQLTPIKG
jgi:hypothetical protein